MDFFLARLALFRKLPAPVLENLRQHFCLIKYHKGEPVFQDGDAPDSVHLLRSGLIKAVKYSPRDEPVILELIAPGGLFGMIAVMDKKAYPVTAVCVLESEAYRIPADYFDELLSKYPDFSRAVFAEVGGHLRHSQALRALAKEPADRRLAYIVWLLSQSVGRELRVRREEIAEMAGTTPETAIRVLADFRKKKMIASGWKRITVLSPERLKDFSGRP